MSVNINYAAFACWCTEGRRELMMRGHGILRSGFGKEIPLRHLLHARAVSDQGFLHRVPQTRPWALTRNRSFDIVKQFPQHTITIQSFADLEQYAYAAGIRLRLLISTEGSPRSSGDSIIRRARTRQTTTSSEGSTGKRRKDLERATNCKPRN